MVLSLASLMGFDSFYRRSLILVRGRDESRQEGSII
jgi:hypothetical protein